jgi:hypothetical protein
VARDLRRYLLRLATSFALFGAAAIITHRHPEHLRWSLALARFLILGAGGGAALFAWGSAISIAYERRVYWPFLLLLGLVVAGGAALALRFG